MGKLIDAGHAGSDPVETIAVPEDQDSEAKVKSDA